MLYYVEVVIIAIFYFNVQDCPPVMPLLLVKVKLVPWHLSPCRQSIFDLTYKTLPTKQDLGITHFSIVSVA